MYKVCHISSAHPRYDIRIFVKECVTLAKFHNVSLIVADGAPDEVKQGVHIYSVSRPNSRYVRMLTTGKLIYHKVLELTPDIIHLHDPELLAIGWKLARKGYKVIYDVHEDLPKQILNKYWIPRLLRPLIAKLASYIEAHCAKRFFGIIAATPIIAERFSHFNNNVITVCNYPVLAELDLATSPKVAWESRHNVLCYIGSIAKNRGIIPLIESLAKSKLSLEIAGIFSGDIDYSGLRKLSGGEYLNYHGVLSREQIIKLLQQVRIGIVTLLPTPSYVESLPIKLFEYMLAGIPVIASDFPLWREIIIKYNCGLLVDPNNSDAIAACSTRLINDEELAQQMGANGHAAVLEHFNWEIESTKLLEFYP